MFNIKCGVGFDEIVIGSERDTVKKYMEAHYPVLPDSYSSTGFFIDEYESIGVILIYLDNVLHHVGFVEPAVVNLEGVEIRLGKSKKADLVSTSLNIEQYASEEMLLYSDLAKVIFTFKTKKQKSKISGLEVISTSYSEHSISQRAVIDRWMESE